MNKRNLDYAATHVDVGQLVLYNFSESYEINRVFSTAAGWVSVGYITEVQRVDETVSVRNCMDLSVSTVKCVTLQIVNIKVIDDLRGLK